MKLHNIELVYEDDFLKVSKVDGISDDLVTISISSSPRPGEDVAKEEFIRTSTMTSNAIFIIDKTNSFGNHFSWEHLTQTILPIIGQRTVRSVGFCMGGFLAIYLSKYIHMDSVVAITPQWGPAEEYLDPELHQWFLDLYTYKIKDMKIKNLDGAFQNQTQYYILNSNFDLDQLQITFFPKLSNITIFEFGEDFGHTIAGQLGEYMDLCVNACWDHDLSYIPNFIKEYYEGKIEILYGSS